MATTKTKEINLTQLANPTFVSKIDSLQIEFEDKVKELEDKDTELYSYIETLHDTAQNAISQLIIRNGELEADICKLNTVVTIISILLLCAIIVLLKSAVGVI